jgi:hypothetical protein
MSYSGECCYERKEQKTWKISIIPDKPSKVDPGKDEGIRTIVTIVIASIIHMRHCSKYVRYIHSINYARILKKSIRFTIQFYRLKTEGSVRIWISGAWLSARELLESDWILRALTSWKD